MRRTGFTLLELLASIAVIALLISILTPAIAGARRAGQMTVCSSNIRQLQLANDLYAHDHGERCLTGAAEFETGNLHRWHGARDDVGESFDSERGDITPYLGGDGSSQAVRSCPTFAHTLESLHEKSKGFESGNGGYGYNNAFLGKQRRLSAGGNWTVVDDTSGSKRTVFANPTATVAFADAALAENELIEYSFIEPRRWPDRPRFRPDPSTHFRHDGRASVAWLDGHVSNESLHFTRGSGVYQCKPSKFGIGWFGERDDNSLYDYE